MLEFSNQVEIGKKVSHDRRPFQFNLFAYLPLLSVSSPLKRFIISFTSKRGISGYSQLQVHMYQPTTAGCPGPDIQLAGEPMRTGCPKNLWSDNYKASEALPVSLPQHRVSSNMLFSTCSLTYRARPVTPLKFLLTH